MKWVVVHKHACSEAIFQIFLANLKFEDKGKFSLIKVLPLGFDQIDAVLGAVNSALCGKVVESTQVSLPANIATKVCA